MAPPPVRGQLEKSETRVTTSGIRLIRLLVGRPPQPIADLVRAAGVTRTAVTEHLNDLIAGGFVERTREPVEGRGRPRHMYAATDAALLLLFTSNQQMLVPAMWRAIDRAGGTELTAKVRRHVSRELAEHYRKRITAKKPEKRLSQLGRIFREEGALVDVVMGEDGQVVLKKRSCPFISMFEESRAVCHVDIEMISEIVGAPVHQIACRHDGDPCCAFALNSSHGK